jgi:hypothetical protein
MIKFGISGKSPHLTLGCFLEAHRLTLAQLYRWTLGRQSHVSGILGVPRGGLDDIWDENQQAVHRPHLAPLSLCTLNSKLHKVFFFKKARNAAKAHTALIRDSPIYPVFCRILQFKYLYKIINFWPVFLRWLRLRFLALGAVHKWRHGFRGGGQRFVTCLTISRRFLRKKRD